MSIYVSFFLSSFISCHHPDQIMPHPQQDPYFDEQPKSRQRKHAADRQRDNSSGTSYGRQEKQYKNDQQRQNLRHQEDLHQQKMKDRNTDRHERFFKMICGAVAVVAATYCIYKNPTGGTVLVGAAGFLWGGGKVVDKVIEKQLDAGQPSETRRKPHRLPDEEPNDMSPQPMRRDSTFNHKIANPHKQAGRQIHLPEPKQQQHSRWEEDSVSCFDENNELLPENIDIE
jgi:hypothetical protein